MKDPLRHARGEYYTPRWLADLVLDEAGYDGAPGRRLLDPSCGLGVFLEAAIARVKDWGAAHGESPPETARRILSEIQGFERNPQSAARARQAYLVAMGEPGEPFAVDRVPIQAADVLLDPPVAGPYDLLAGNPPWVRWDHLPEDYRAATLPLWKRYGLFSLRGFASVLGGGKKDLCMLFTYAAADRFLRPGGMLAFLVSQEVFKAKGAGEGFRRFRLGEVGEELGVTAAHDFANFQPFQGAANKSAAILLVKGQATRYPVPYHVWTRDRSGRLARETLQAHPVGTATGPWRTAAAGDAAGFLHGENAYRPVLGANANPYGVFWLEVLRAMPEGLLEVRNLPELGKSDISPVTAVVEPDLVYPALRGADIQRWCAVPRVHVLLVQDPVTRTGYPEDAFRARWPRTWDYISRFREVLISRALYRRYHRRAGRPFYSQFNIGPALMSPFKVVWKRMSNDLCAAVVSSWDGPLGSKMVAPLETTSFIGVETAREAHYLCAFLNSQLARSYVKSLSAAGRGFGAPSAVATLSIPKFDPRNAAHLALAEASPACQARPGADAGLDGLVKAALSRLLL